MESASVSELKARLSHYLHLVRRGGEVQVTDRGHPVARLVGLDTSGDDARQRLAASGSVRPGSGRTRSVLDHPPLATGESLVEALIEDRAERL